VEEMKVGDKIKVFAPATVANVACGFDVLGFAIDRPGDELELEIIAEKTVKILEITGDDGVLPRDPEKNSAAVGIIEFLKKINSNFGCAIKIHKKMPSGSGLGSSAASAVAGVFAVNKIFGEPLTKQELLPFLLEAERAACDAAIADNVAASLFGGFILVRSYEPLEVIQLPIPDKLFATVIFPHLTVLTKDAREILPKEIPLRDSLRQTANLGGLIIGLHNSDYGLISRSLKDYIAEPYRSKLIPGFDLMKQAIMDNGGLGGSISGSGPSVFALSTSLEIAEKIGAAMKQIMTNQNIDSNVFVSKINTQGPSVIQ
jgi:homoserine kinase